MDGEREIHGERGPIDEEINWAVKEKYMEKSRTSSANFVCIIEKDDTFLLFTLN